MIILQYFIIIMDIFVINNEVETELHVLQQNSISFNDI